jgi:hypothetical protein
MNTNSTDRNIDGFDQAVFETAKTLPRHERAYLHHVAAAIFDKREFSQSSAYGLTARAGEKIVRRVTAIAKATGIVN